MEKQRKDNGIGMNIQLNGDEYSAEISMHGPIDTKLTVMEAQDGARIGCARRIESMDSKREQPLGYNSSDAWRNDIEGACAEFAYCKAMNIHWSRSINTFKDADCGNLTQVRWTHHVNGSLIVRDGDPDDHCYVLVVGACPSYRIIGWIKGHHAKNNDYLKSPGELEPAYFVPQNKLSSTW